MDPQAQSCPHPQCPTRGQTAQGHIKVHSYRERRFRCTICRTTTSGRLDGKRRI